MIRLFKYAALAATLCFSITTAEAVGKPKTCPCYTATTHISDKRCPPFEPTPPCIVPLCVRITTTTIPGPNTACPTTPTLTSLLPCRTACPTGCAGTVTSTETFSSSCLPTTTAPPPTLTTHTRPCYTRTLPATKKCPEDELGCAPPDCLYLSTTTVPPGPVAGCETTRTVVADRTCKGRCDFACGTVWATETATAWKK